MSWMFGYIRLVETRRHLMGAHGAAVVTLCPCLWWSGARAPAGGISANTQPCKSARLPLTCEHGPGPEASHLHGSCWRLLPPPPHSTPSMAARLLLLSSLPSLSSPCSLRTGEQGAWGRQGPRGRRDTRHSQDTRQGLGLGHLRSCKEGYSITQIL